MMTLIITTICLILAAVLSIVAFSLFKSAITTKEYRM